jgi:LPS-assembly lipoprotein
MSSGKVSRRGALAALGLALLASGCNFRPLYGSLPGGGSLTSALSAVEIAPPRSREGQKLRNELIFMFTGGGEPSAPLYRLNITTVVSRTALTITPVGGLPTSEGVIGTASFRLQRISDGKAILTDSLTAHASYDRSTQRFAAIRAQRDAEDRAMTTLAEMIRTRIAAKLASGQ